MNLAHTLTELVATRPHQPALIFAHEPPLTYAALGERTARLAGGLRALGIGPGDRVILLAPISANLYAGLIALFQLGAAAVFLDPQAKPAQLEQAAGLAAAKALVGTRRALWLSGFLPALRRIPVKLSAEGYGRMSLNYLAESGPLCAEVVEVEPETPALITFTGGSTTRCPRGVVRTHRLLAAQHLALGRALPLRSGDVDLPAFSIFTLHNLAAGVTSVIPDFPFCRPAAVNPARVLRQIEEYGVTTAAGSPAYWQRIADYCLAHGRRLPLRRILTGGAPVSPRLIQALTAAAPQAEVLGIYGSTEAEPVALMPAEQILAETAERTANGAGIPLGWPVAGVRVRVLDEQGGELPPAVCGEIWVSGTHVARAYFSAEDTATAKRLDSEGTVWHRMGDMGYLDEAGCLWMVGRAHTVIRREGRMVHPLPVEAMAETLLFVRRAALVKLPAQPGEARVALAIEFTRAEPIPFNWRARLAEHFAGRPRVFDEVRVVRHMPVDARHNSRIDYARLQARLSAGS